MRLPSWTDYTDLDGKSFECFWKNFGPTLHWGCGLSSMLLSFPNVMLRYFKQHKQNDIQHNWTEVAAGVSVVEMNRNCLHTHNLTWMSVCLQQVQFKTTDPTILGSKHSGSSLLCQMFNRRNILTRKASLYFTSRMCLLLSNGSTKCSVCISSKQVQVW